MVFTGCSDKNGVKEVINLVESYEGYGVIRFTPNSTGSIRYLEFYPLLIEKNKTNFKDINKFNIKDGIVLRHTNKSMLWQSLIIDKNIKLDNEGYGLAVILIKYHKKNNDNKFVKEYDNYLILKNRNIKVKMFDPESNKIDVDNFKVIQGI
ncbi:hypothetical protein B0A68_21090 [Flavobacterium reichenbachii]|uniref:Uncharacterized protein n=1 Tax=Flavobacterium reichenbachii TaxID=362418 RepID=A0A085ZDW2_9FLAO|nr:hypothetical protein IW19_23455 [Flavobacterium reichenbachii]OXB11123.1 hypothetical protein B0A68_21090 [Flavobacterium reichenbachii]